MIRWNGWTFNHYNECGYKHQHEKRDAHIQPGRTDFYKTILNAIPSAVFVVEDDVCIVDFNSAAAKLLGKNPEVLLRKRAGAPVPLHLLITAAPFEHENRPLTILILEDITELIALRGLLPMCAHCKKIRDDNNYWRTVEQLFSAHLDVDFSHGLCPECIKALYPQHTPPSESSPAASI